MRKKRLAIILSLMILICACNLPIAGNEPDDIFDQPAQTLTAMFAAYPTQTPDGEQERVEEQPTATATTEVQPTATPVVNERPGPQVIANYLNDKPVLDGDWGDWKSKAVAYPAAYVVYGLGEWDDGQDLEASFITGWDESFLYLGVKVKDEKYVQNAEKEMIFKGDSVEILIDTDLLGDFSSSSLGGDDFQIGFSPGKGSTSGAKEAYLWYPTSLRGSEIDQIDVTAISTLGLYRMEIKIPWSVLKVTPSVGMRLGFVFSASDNDEAGTTIQQSMVSNVPGRVFTNPTTWGEIILD